MLLKTNNFSIQNNLIVLSEKDIKSAKKYRSTVLAGNNYIAPTEIRSKENGFEFVQIPYTDKVMEYTDTYYPVDNTEIFVHILNMGNKLDYKVSSITLNESQKQGKFFGVVRFIDPTTKIVGPGVGFRNSYNKAFSFAIACGLNVHLCSNLSFSDIKDVRKHTQGVYDFLDSMFSTMHHHMQERYIKEKEFLVSIKSMQAQKDDIFSLVGKAAVNRLFTPTQVSKFVNEIEERKMFKGDTVFDLYMHATEACKMANESDILQTHTQIKNLFLQHYSLV